MKALLTAAALSLAALPAAAAVTFGFDGGSPDSASKSFTVDGLTVTVTAGTFSGPSPSTIDFSTRRVDHSSGRLGADNAPGGGSDGNQIDGANGAANDILVFSFDKQVRIDALWLSNTDGNDNYTYGLVDGTSFDRAGTSNIDFAGNPIVLNLGLGGLDFGLGAIQSNDDFRLNRLQVSIIPLPAAGLILLTALGGAGAAYRRGQKKKAA